MLCASCGKAGPDLGTEIQGRWLKGNEGWVMFSHGMVCRVDDRALVGSYAVLDEKTILVEEITGDATMRNLWQAALTPKGLELTYPGGEKVVYGRAKPQDVKPEELFGKWTANVGVGKVNTFVFDSSGAYLAVRWIRSSSRDERDRRQRRVVEAGRWKVAEGTRLDLSGLRRRPFTRSYEFRVTGDDLSLTSTDKKTRVYKRVAR